MEKETILSEIIFEKPERIVAPYSWIKHIPFAFFMIDILKPGVFVELGVHTGNSFCAFCQAVKKLRLKTKCFAVDTWKGDELAGMYEEKIFSDLAAYMDEQYKDNATLLRMTFDEAVNLFKDGSIDLLHIDGRHTYDDVKKDFKTWLPKISDKGVVIIHDTTVKEEGYGVWKFWDEISNTYLSFGFEHGYGLGIAAVGDKVNEQFKRFINEFNKNISYNSLFNKLGKLIYFEEKEPITKLYIDCGAGFTEDISITQKIDLSEEFINISFDLSNLSEIRSLRWDPLENKWCIVKLKNIRYQDKRGNRRYLDLNKITFNGKSSEDPMMASFAKKLCKKGWIIFETIDPQIYLPVQGELRFMAMEGKIEIIDQIYIDDQYRKKEQIIEDINIAAQSHDQPSDTKINRIRKYFHPLKLK